MPYLIAPIKTYSETTRIIKLLLVYIATSAPKNERMIPTVIPIIFMVRSVTNGDKILPPSSMLTGKRLKSANGKKTLKLN